MLGWLFGKKTSGNERAVSPTAAATTPVPAATPAPLPTSPASPAVDWASRLSEAQGDDAALLELAGSRAPIEVRQAAVEAIASEAVLKSAERTLRDRDRGIARSARQRRTALAARREAHLRAATLIASAGALAGQPLIPLNRLAELDRAWQALGPALLESEQRSDFAAAMAALSTLSRERGDSQLKAERWAARARDALAALQRVTAGVAAGTVDRSQLASSCNAARDVLAASTVADAGPGSADALRQAVRAAELVDERVAFLEALPDARAATGADAAANTTADAAADAVAESASEANAGAAPQATVDRDDFEQHWRAGPAIDDSGLRDLLEARFSAWRQARLDARQAARARRAEQARSSQRAARQAEAAALDAALERTEQALADGQLDAAERQLGEVASLTSRASVGEVQRARIGAVQAGHARLKGWQQWGGGVAREELVAEAEALAASGSEAAAPSSPPLSIKARSEWIAGLRARWKELDRLGGGGGALWRRFDAALTAAYQPVAAHTAAQRAARALNLAARRRLLDALEAVALPGTPAGQADAPPAEGEPTTAATATLAPDWKAIAQALDRWLAEWRQLGPLEHTVPRDQREPLLARTSQALARLEVPLALARDAARGVREQLIARARRLADDAASGAPGRDLTGRVRELQGAWQQQARAVPLTRAAESAAWADFRAAIDAVFTARAAAAGAQDAVLQAHAAERSALIDRLASLAGDLAPVALRGELAAADAAWQRAGPPPRDAGAQFDARFRAARDAAVRRLAEAEQAEQRAEADALRQKLALCEALERDDPGFDRTTLGERWRALPALRNSWEHALAQRAGLAAAGPAPASAAPAEALLLQLEEQFALASPPALQQARRALKLQALKAALEGRGAAAEARLPAHELMTLLLGRSGLDSGQRDRLARALDAAPTPAAD